MEFDLGDLASLAKAVLFLICGLVVGAMVCGYAQGLADMAREHQYRLFFSQVLASRALTEQEAMAIRGASLVLRRDLASHGVILAYAALGLASHRWLSSILWAVSMVVVLWMCIRCLVMSRLRRSMKMGGCG